MTELEYGIAVANKYDLLLGDDDPTEMLSKNQVDAKKKKADDKGKGPAPGNVLKEKTTRSGKAPATGDVDSKTKEKERKIEGKSPREDQKGGHGRKTGGDEEWGVAKSAGRSSGAADANKSRNVPNSAGQQGRNDRQRNPKTDAGGVAGGKENTSDPIRRPQKNNRPGEESAQQRSAAPGGPRRFGGGPRFEGSAPPRRDQDSAAAGGAMTGDQEVPMDNYSRGGQFGDGGQRTGFGGGRGYRGGSSFRGGRASPRHQPSREPPSGEASQHGRGREYDRRSGSNKTGVKPVEKREGGGAYNWGSYRDDAEITTETVTAPAAPTGEEGAPVEGQVVAEGQEGDAAAQEEEAKVAEKTLKEWMEEEERNRVRPKFSTRAANEGEPEQKVFQRMRRVQREKANADGLVEVVEYVEVDVDEDGHVPAGSSSKGGRGGPFQLVFAPASRPTRGTGRVSGPDVGRPRGGGGGRGGGFGGRGGRGGGPGGRQAAPPAADEANFPPLG